MSDPLGSYGEAGELVQVSVLSEPGPWTKTSSSVKHGGSSFMVCRVPCHQDSDVKLS